jgi:hypothetical protein
MYAVIQKFELHHDIIQKEEGKWVMKNFSLLRF